MNEQDVKNLIEAFIVANGVNAITADVLRPILIAMLTQPNDEIGDLTQLNTVTQDNLVDAINEIYNSISSITNDGIKLYQGDANPNVEPPDSYNIADFYFEEGNDLWQFNGTEWVRAAGGVPMIPSLNQVTNEGSGSLVTIQSPKAVNSNDLVNLGQVEEMISEIPTPILFTTDASLYLDPITKELRANTGLSTENFEYASGVQEFTLVDEPSFVISLMLNLVAINNPLTDYSIDGKKLTILKPLEATDKINITYQFIITT